MYTDENSDKDCGLKTPQNSPTATKKSLSTVAFRNNIEDQNEKLLSLRATQSYTGAIDELKLCNTLQSINLCQTDNVTHEVAVCPCGCLLRPGSISPFRTREKNTLALQVVPPEVLMHHGNQYEPNEIAMFWKKDCRMFLWKGKSRMKNIINAESYKN